jgi:Zn-dependent protease with chaperone function
VFLVKALFGVTRGGRSRDFEVTPELEPELFRFLHRLADETGAPRPHRVFLSPLVNAAVFYDLSLLNLLFPSKKNLELGLGLVNVLTLSDLKAVLAHEFGHFAQRSMAVGRWVYVAQQIVGEIVARRDWFDRGLAVLSAIDLRVAWIGWLLRLIVWSIRALVDSVFSLVVLAQRALSREMEFQADMVSVSVAGSDAIVHALYRLNAADHALDAALDIAASELQRGRLVPDLFALESRVIEHMREILDEPNYGLPPELPATGGEQQRVFEEKLAQPPRMWSTHPSNREREDNAKRRYVASVGDERSAWLLFRDPAQLRRAMTTHTLEGAAASRELVAATPEAALASVDDRFRRRAFDRNYRGTYLRRSAVMHAESVSELTDAGISSEDLAEKLEGLYPLELSEKLKRFRTLEEEFASLKALHDGVLQAPGGVIRHRDRTLKPRELPGVIDEVKAERKELGDELSAHDRACRSLHRAAAVALGRGWAEHLDGLLSLCHYAAHAEADLEDARGHFLNVLAVVTADGRVSAAERRRLVLAATELYTALWHVDAQKREVRLCEPVARRLELAGLGAPLPSRFNLDAPSAENIGQWVNEIQEYYVAYLGPIAALAGASLDELLEAEAHLKQAYVHGADPGDAPAAARAPGRYVTRVEGSERERQKRLPLWDRFVNADGFLPGLARFALAAGMVGSVVGFGGSVGTAKVVVYNGFEFPVAVTLGPQQGRVAPASTATFDLEPNSQLHLEASRHGGQRIESFDAEVSSLRTYVYNVAGASPLIEWTAVYGNTEALPDRPLGHPRFEETSVDVVLDQPPTSVSTKGGGAKRSVLSGLAGTPPDRMLHALRNDKERAELTLVNAEHADPESPHVAEWLTRANGLPGFDEVLAARLARDPNELVALRAQQDAANPQTRKALCERMSKTAAERPHDVNFEYLSVRCMEDGPEQDRRFRELYHKHPDHPYAAYAAGYLETSAQRYSEAAKAFFTATHAVPLRQDAATMLQRIKRVDPGASVPLDTLQYAEDAKQLIALESGEGVPDGPLKAYARLAQGDLSGALALAESTPDVHARVMLLAAASDGATADIVRMALSLPAQSIAPASVWSALALATRERADTTSLEALAKTGGGSSAETLLRYLRQPKFFEDAAAVDAAASQLHALAGPQLYVMGSILRGKHAPPRWRRVASAFLFVTERPYFNLLDTGSASQPTTGEVAP